MQQNRLEFFKNVDGLMQFQAKKNINLAMETSDSS